MIHNRDRCPLGQTHTPAGSAGSSRLSWVHLHRNCSVTAPGHPSQVVIDSGLRHLRSSATARDAIRHVGISHMKTPPFNSVCNSVVSKSIDQIRALEFRYLPGSAGNLRNCAPCKYFSASLTQTRQVHILSFGGRLSRLITGTLLIIS